MNAIDPAQSLAIGLVAMASGILGGMLGMAGGIFIIPALTLGFGLDMRHAVGASLVSVIACSCGSAAGAMENRLTNVRLGVLLEIGTTLGALTGVALAGVVPESVLYLLFAAIMILSAHQMARKRGRDDLPSPPGPGSNPWATRLRLHSTYPDPTTGREIGYETCRPWLGLLLMYGAGVMSSLLGIGSGVLKIPAMDSAMKLPIKVSAATSNFMIGVTAAASAGIYQARGDVLVHVAAPVALGSLLGARLGAEVLAGISGQRIRSLFVVVLLALAVKMIMAAFQGPSAAAGG